MMDSPKYIHLCLEISLRFLYMYKARHGFLCDMYIVVNNLRITIYDRVYRFFMNLVVSDYIEIKLPY